MEMIVFCGLQGAGKSSFYSKHFADTHLRINLDMLRTRRRESAIVDACLSVGQRLVVDNTNISREERQRYLVPGAEAHFRLIAYFFDILFETCAERNLKRTGRARIKEAGLHAMRAKLEPPSFEEGFAEIFTVDEDGIAKAVAEGQT